jgi:pimeloyl-ACP methyl ester carboxylesterase
MKRLCLSLTTLLLLSLACNFGGVARFVATPTSTPAPTQPSSPRGRCGDGVCDGPENPANCAADCPAAIPEAPTEAPSLPTPTQPAPAPQPSGPAGRCGDGVCDGPENPASCPDDCTASGAVGTPAPPGTYDTYRVTNPTSGVELFVAVMRPQTWDGEPLPTLVIIPGGVADSSAITDKNIGRMATEAGFAVVAFDPDGRGQSEGEEDHNGFTHQDGLAAVIEFAIGLPEVDADRMGMISFSYGVTLASGLLARYPDLPVRFLIDWEGPADRYDTTVGCEPSPRYDWPDCEDDDAWAEREALTFIAQAQVPYQRIQTEQDHVQPDVAHAVYMVNAAVEGASPWVRLNDYPPNQTYDPDAPPAMFPEKGGPSSDQVMLKYAEEMFEMSGAESGSTSESGGTPVYVTVGTHLEEKLPLPCGETCDDRCRREYERFRSNLLTYADLFLDYGVEWNLQTNDVGDFTCDGHGNRIP